MKLLSLCNVRSHIFNLHRIVAAVQVDSGKHDIKKHKHLQTKSRKYKPGDLGKNVGRPAVKLYVMSIPRVLKAKRTLSLVTRFGPLALCGWDKSNVVPQNPAFLILYVPFAAVRRA